MIKVLNQGREGGGGFCSHAARWHVSPGAEHRDYSRMSYDRDCVHSAEES